MSDQLKVDLSFDIRNRHIPVYDTNPYSAGLDSPNERVLKITVKGIPLSVDDGEIVKMLEQFDLNFTSELKYEHIRHPESKKNDRNFKRKSIHLRKPTFRW